MDYPEKIKNFIKEHWKQLGFVFFTAMLFSVVTIILQTYSVRRSNMEPPVIQPVDESYKFNLKADINRLECIFEQRRCFYNNLGLGKETIIKSCYDITFCDTSHGGGE